MLDGHKLARFRKMCGLSQDELSDKVGVSRQTISKWEVGSVVPSTEHLLQLAKIFDIPLAELIGEPVPPQEVPQMLIETVAVPDETAARALQMARRIFIAVCALGLCILLAGVAVLFGFHSITQQLDPDRDAIPMQELEREEVDCSSLNKIYTGEPKS